MADTMALLFSRYSGVACLRCEVSWAPLAGDDAAETCWSCGMPGTTWDAYRKDMTRRREAAAAAAEAARLDAEAEPL